MEEGPNLGTRSNEIAPSLPLLEVGTEVYVRNRFLGDWSCGFEVAEILSNGYRLQRVSDGQVFPDVFPFEDVCLERRQHPLRVMGKAPVDRRRRGH